MGEQLTTVGVNSLDSVDICHMSALEMAHAIRTKKLSSVEIVDAILDRIDMLNPKVNAYCTIVPDFARKQAIKAEAAIMRGDIIGPLHGVPVSIKDLILTKDIRTTCGSKIYENYIPQRSASVVERLEAAGAIIIGKTNTSEFGWVGITDNLIFGATKNPWNLKLTPGGSSGGAAVAVALCMGPLAIGSDSGGSIRIPSSFCGVFGFKPSFGRVPQYPNCPAWETVNHIGPITRSVKDAALVMEVIAGRDDRDHLSLPEKELCYLPFLDNNIKDLKIAWSKDLGYAVVDPQVLRITEAAVKNFAACGCTVETINIQIEKPARAYTNYIGIRLAAALHDKIAEWRDCFDPA